MNYIAHKNYLAAFFILVLCSFSSFAEDTSKVYIREDGSACRYEDARYPLNFSFKVGDRERFVCIFRVVCEKVPGPGVEKSTGISESNSPDACSFISGKHLTGAGPRASLLPHLEPINLSQPTSSIPVTSSRGKKGLFRSYVGKKYHSDKFGTCEYRRAGLPASLEFHLTPEPDSKILRTFCYAEAKCETGEQIGRCEKLKSGECPLLGYCLDHPIADGKVASVKAAEVSNEDLEALMEEDKKEEKKVSFIISNTGHLVRHQSSPEQNASVAASKPTHNRSQTRVVPSPSSRLPRPRLGQS